MALNPLSRVPLRIGQAPSESSLCLSCLGAKAEFGFPAFADDHSIQLKGRSLSAKYWVIATGSSPASPPIEGIERTKILKNRDIFSLDRLPTSMIILGAGSVGAEMAQAFCRLGTRVTLVQRGGRSSPRRTGTWRMKSWMS